MSLRETWERCEYRSIKSASKRQAQWRKKSTRAKPVLAVTGVKYRSGRFLRAGRAFFAPGTGDLGRTLLGQRRISFL